MKQIMLFIITIVLSVQCYCQIKVDRLGHVGIGTNYPNLGYKVHVKGDVLLTNYPEVPHYEFQFKVGQKDGAVIGCTGGIIDFYTSSSGYNTLLAKNFRTHSTWDKGESSFDNGLKIIAGLKPYCFSINDDGDGQTSVEYGISPDELLKLTPGIIDIICDGYAIDYDQLIPILVQAIQDQQKQIKVIQSIIIEQERNMLVSNDDTKSPNNNADINGVENSTLFDCSPNPFYEDTKIRISIHRIFNSAKLVICNINGQCIMEIPINCSGEHVLVINGSELEAGIYLYSLIIDGTTIDTKRMFLSK